jgi:dienelactone hydrolase
MISRRTLLGGAAALTAGLALSSTAWAAASNRVRLRLPAPTGRHGIGTAALHLVDHARQDPWLSTPRPRELMVSVWYPADSAGRGEPAPWLPPAALVLHRAQEESKLQQIADIIGEKIDVSLDRVDFPIAHAWKGAPVDRSGGPYPVVLFSPGAEIHREQGTALVEDLASHGYVVVTIGHTYDAPQVEFPGGRVESHMSTLDGTPHLVVAARRDDTRFVLDMLTGLQQPAGLRDCVDLGRIGMFGHSLGGATTGQTMAADGRVVAGLDLDGHVIPDVPFGPPQPPEEAARLAGAVAERIGDRPFMIMSSDGKGPDELGALMSGFWHNLSGWRRFLSLTGSTHGGYTDVQVLYPQLATAGVITPAMLGRMLGTVDPERAVTAQRAYIRAFFDRWLCGHAAPLLDGPSAGFPEITFF